jgi:Xaa-Pro aminopeptidase
MDHRTRRDALRADHPDVDALLITASSDVRYLSGFTGSNGAVLVGREAAEDILVTDERYAQRIDRSDVAQVELRRRIPELIAVSAERLGWRRLGVDAEQTTLAAAVRLRAAVGEVVDIVELSAPVAGLRAQKDPAEIARLQVACTITAQALAWFATDVLRPGLTERAAARTLEARFEQLGADGVAFPTIVAGGPNGASPHHDSGDRPLAAGELVIVDCGAEVDGYRADMTRTLAVDPSSACGGQLREVHALVAAANAAARSLAAPGVAISDIDRAARDVIAAAGFAAAFVHPTGHGIGLDVHEVPLVWDRATGSLRPGTSFTIEPGVYLPGLGGVRIEDSLVASDRGCDVMTEMERDLAGP